MHFNYEKKSLVKNANHTRVLEYVFVLQSNKCFLTQPEVADAGWVLEGGKAEVGLWSHQEEMQQVVWKTATTRINNKNEGINNKKGQDTGGRRAATESARPCWGSGRDEGVSARQGKVGSLPRHRGMWCQGVSDGTGL